MLIELVSFVSPIQTTSQHDKEIMLKNETVEVVTSITSIVSSVLVPKKVVIEVTSFTSSIFSEAFYEVPYRIETRNLLSHLKSLQADLSVLYPISNKVVNGYVSVLENPSSVSTMDNMTNVHYIENPSNVEVI